MGRAVQYTALTALRCGLTCARMSASPRVSASKIGRVSTYWITQNHVPTGRFGPAVAVQDPAVVRTLRSRLSAAAGGRFLAP
jgi:hypothetical protein